MVKTKNKLTVIATSLAILATPMMEKPHTVEAIKSYTITNKDYKSQEDFETSMRKYKIEQIRFQQKERAEEIRKIEEVRIAKEKEITELKAARNNFYYIVQNKDITTIDLRTASGLTIEQANSILDGTGLEGLGKGFVEAEEKHGVNAYYLMAHAAWESTWGTSPLAANKNNLFGFTAYDASPESSATKFASKEDCIDVVASYVRSNYLEDNGQYHNGPNLQGMNIKYATDKDWSNGIGSLIVSFVNEVEEVDTNSL